MTKAEFIAKLGDPTPFNSNNDWGFAGAQGNRYKLNGCTITLATTGHRHGKGTAFVRVDAPTKGNYSGSGFIDLTQRQSNYDKILEIINSIETDEVYLQKVNKYNEYK